MSENRGLIPLTLLGTGFGTDAGNRTYCYSCSHKRELVAIATSLRNRNTKEQQS